MVHDDPQQVILLPKSVMSFHYFRSMILKNSDEIDPTEDLSVLSKEGLENRKYMQQLLQDRIALLPKNKLIKNETF